MLAHDSFRNPMLSPTNCAGVLISCAMPAASWPTASSFCAWRSCSSKPLRRVMSAPVTMSPEVPLDPPIGCTPRPRNRVSSPRLNVRSSEERKVVAASHRVTSLLKSERDHWTPQPSSVRPITFAASTPKVAAAAAFQRVIRPAESNPIRIEGIHARNSSVSAEDTRRASSAFLRSASLASSNAIVSSKDCANCPSSSAVWGTPVRTFMAPLPNRRVAVTSRFSGSMRMRPTKIQAANTARTAEIPRIKRFFSRRRLALRMIGSLGMPTSMYMYGGKFSRRRNWLKA